MVDVELVEALPVVAIRFRVAPVDAGAVQAGQAGDAPVHLVLAPRDRRAVAVGALAARLVVFDQGKVVGQVLLVGGRFLDGDSVVGIVGEDRSGAERLDRDRRLARVGGQDLLAGPPVHVVDAGLRLAVFVAPFAADAIGHVGLGRQVAFVGPVDERSGRADLELRPGVVLQFDLGDPAIRSPRPPSAKGRAATRRRSSSAASICRNTCSATDGS